MTARMTVAQLAAPGVGLVRDIYSASLSEAERVAALIEIAGAASAMARGLVKLRHIDPLLLNHLVSAQDDIAPVLGRGRWLPTMTRHITPPAPMSHPRKKSAGRKREAGRQLPLFDGFGRRGR